MSTASMRAAVLVGAGGPEVLTVREVPRPTPGPGQVLVRVRATALNRADILQREGRYPPPGDAPRDIPGMELAGEVEALGPGASLWRVGDRVFGIIGGGAYAEYVVGHERTLAAIPASLDWSAAAAVPEAFITAHDALVSQASLRASDHVLVHAVASGVGLAAVQLVRALGAIPYGTTRTAEKLDRAREYGLEDGWLASGDFAALGARVASWTDGRGMDIVLDLLGGPYVRASVDVLAPKGRLMLIGTIAGGHGDLPLGRMLGARLTVKGTVLRARPLEEKILATRAFAAEVVPLFDRGLLRPVIDREFPLDQIADAHRALESNTTVGKIVITLD